MGMMEQDHRHGQQEARGRGHGCWHQSQKALALNLNFATYWLLLTGYLLGHLIEFFVPQFFSSVNMNNYLPYKGPSEEHGANPLSSYFPVLSNTNCIAPLGPLGTQYSYNNFPFFLMAA